MSANSSKKQESFNNIMMNVLNCWLKKITLSAGVKQRFKAQTRGNVGRVGRPIGHSRVRVESKLHEQVSQGASWQRSREDVGTVMKLIIADLFTL